MTHPTLVVLAAGASRRFGGLKQLEEVGPGGQALLDYALFDGARAGFGDAVVVVRPQLEAAFRRHFRRSPPRLPVRFARQAGPGEGAPTTGGTGLAVLAAAGRVSGSFAVVNADDLYGREAYETVASHLARHRGHAVVAYRLERTLSGADAGPGLLPDHGVEVGRRREADPEGPTAADGEPLHRVRGVSRALLHARPDGSVSSVEELVEVRRRPDGTFAGLRAGGEPVRLEGGAPVSMNFWAFRPSIFAFLESALRFFRSARPMDSPEEFRLPDVVGHGLRSGELDLEALPTDAVAFGLTFSGDRERVAHRLAALTARGDYPPVWSGVEQGGVSRDGASGGVGAGGVDTEEAQQRPSATHPDQGDPGCS